MKNYEALPIVNTDIPMPPVNPPREDHNPDLEYENKKLRELLWLRHGCSFGALYGDDGEMQCSACGIDFKRWTVDAIEERFYQMGVEILDAEYDGQT